MGAEVVIDAGSFGGFEGLVFPNRCDAVGTKLNVAVVHASGLFSGESVQDDNPANVNCEGGGIDGDIDGDGDVDMDDLLIVVGCFGQLVANNPDCARADVASPPDGDGVINILDVSFVASNFTP